MDTEQSSPLSKEKMDFFLLTAHELRTSLSAMKWAFKMLADGDYGSLTDEQKTIIDQLAAGNEKMIATLNTTMATLKSDTAITYAQSAIDLSVCIDSLLKAFAGEARQKNITLTYHPAPAPLTVIGDEQKLCMAFHNILENALKYSPSGTEVIVSLSGNGSVATLSVQDHGIGVPVDKLPHLFEKFFRAGNSAETGTGLGLYGSKLIIERHGGTIAIDSQEHVGSTVTVTLPLQH